MGEFLKIHGIKCDHCIWKDDSIILDKYDELKEWLNKPCPECGESLLTEEDLNSIKYLFFLDKILSSLPGPMKWLLKLPVRLTGRGTKVEMDGTGKIDLKPTNIQFGPKNRS